MNKLNAATTLRVAAAQLAASDDIEANLQHIAALAAEARKAGAVVVAFPEASTYDWQASGRGIAAFADKYGLVVADELAQIAAANSITLVAGTFAADGAQTRNRMLVYGPDGARVAQYDKVHLYDSFGYRESDKVKAAEPDEKGSELTVFDAGPFHVGVFNCYDLRFPEITRALIDAGADTLLIGSAWVAGEHKVDHWRTLLKARAIENTSYVIASCQSGPASVGHSMVVDPFGEILSECESQMGLAVADLSLEHLRDVRKIVPSLEHRRYGVTPRRTTTEVGSPAA